MRTPNAGELLNAGFCLKRPRTFPAELTASSHLYLVIIRLASVLFSG